MKTIKHTHPGRPRYIMLFPKSLTFTFTALMAANGVDTRRTLGNGAENSNYGKGDNATMLTIRKNLKHAIKQGAVFLLKGFTAVPDSDGLGRRGLLYMQTSTDFDRALAQAKVRGAEGVEVDDAVKAAWAKAELKLAEGFAKAQEKAAKVAARAAGSAPKATRKAVTRKGKSKSTAPTSTAEYEAQKAAILAPVVTIAPAAPSTIPDAVHNPIVAPEAAPAPVAPTPEPVAVTPAAPVAETAPEVVPTPEAAPVVPVAPVAEPVAA